jgi:hypothetical protein
MMPLLERDTCIICLCSPEDGTGQLIQNSRCSCRYMYHEVCFAKIAICPMCQVAFAAVVAQLQQQPQQQEDASDRCYYKFIITLIVVCILSVLGYFSAVLT